MENIYDDSVYLTQKLKSYCGIKKINEFHDYIVTLSAIHL